MRNEAAMMQVCHAALTANAHNGLSPKRNYRAPAEVAQNCLRTLKAEHAQKRKDMARAASMI